MARITIDPITRIEGHLRVDVEVNNNRVTNAWSSAQMFRGIETILQGRDPRDAWVFAQRFCGVCTTVHALASVRAVEDALKLEIPKNAQYIRNIVTGAHDLQDSIVHFYHLSALDWVDIVSALDADPVAAAKIAQSYSDWPGNSPAAFAAAKNRLAKFVSTGKLGIFGTGYWGHPAMKLPPEVNLIAFAHYLTALDYQRRASQTVAVLGGKDPHIQNLCVGGVATAVNMDNISTFTIERAALIRQNLREVQEFCNKAYLPDLIAIASFYPEWFNYGAGVTNYLSVPEYPIDGANTVFQEKGGIITNGDFNSFREITSWSDAELRNGVTENTDMAWYDQTGDLHPWKGQTNPKYTDFDPDGKYTWCKAPRFNGESFQVGPLSQILAAYLAKDPRTVELVNSSVNTANTLLSGKGVKIGLNNLHSTLGRHLARGIRCQIAAERALENLELLLDNIGSGDKTYANPVGEFPNGVFEGAGFNEAPRGMLSHWVVIDNGKIARYQAVVPSTWNAGPRDNRGKPSPYELSLLNNPVADEKKPLEVIRTVHSFDPCIACAVNTFDPEGKEIVNITID